MSDGRFVVFEGADFAGKSTQIGLARESLAARGIECVVTREPGGGAFGEKMRELILAVAPPTDARAEALAMFAARREHAETRIRPALDAGRWILCDRFSDSTRAYQGAGGGLAREIIDQIESLCDLPRPDLTIVIDIPPEAAAKRRPRDGGDRYDSAAAEFQARVRAAFLDLARRNPAAAIVDGDRPREEIARDILSLLAPLSESRSARK